MISPNFSITPMTDDEVTTAILTTGKRGKARHPQVAALASLQPGTGIKIQNCCISSPLSSRKDCPAIRRLASAKRRWKMSDVHIRHTGNAEVFVYRDREAGVDASA